MLRCKPLVCPISGFIFLILNSMKKQKIIRNIGIMAHVDAGKTTVTERILYYTGLIRQMGNVDSGNTVMDTDPQEAQRGITISSASITTYWQLEDSRYQVNLIDTPGHVDFTAEVERALRVLDGAVAVFCARSGVQPQSETVWRQAGKYGIPCLAFVNKMDRQGADFFRVVEDMKEKLGANAVAIQLPCGSEDRFHAVIDLVRMQMLTWPDTEGRSVIRQEIPEEWREEARMRRRLLLEEIALCDETFFARISAPSGEPDVAEIDAALRRTVLSRQLVPVLCGSAFRNKGVQPLLDAAVRYLPAPEDILPVSGIHPLTQETIRLQPATGSGLAALAFKVIADDFGKLTLVRVYSGTLKQGESAWTSRNGKTVRVSRLLRVLSDKFEPVEEIEAGDIGAVVGWKDVKTGDTIASPETPVVLGDIRFPEPVIGYAIEARNSAGSEKLALALSRLLDEDPTLQVETGEQTGQTILKGMGELHLEVVLEKIASRFGVEVNKGHPQVAFKERFTLAVEHRETLRRQNGGAGSFASICFELSPGSEGSSGLEFVNEIRGGAIPKEFILSVEKGFTAAMQRGVLSGYPVESMKIRLTDGTVHEKDSHAQDFEEVAHIAFREAARKAGPQLLEPVMLVEVETPAEFTGAVTGDLNRRRGLVKSMEINNGLPFITAEVPLSELFGYVTALRSFSQGRAHATMQLHGYRPVPGR